MLVLAPGDHRLDGMSTQPLANPRVIVSLVAGERLGPSSRLSTWLANADAMLQNLEPDGKLLHVLGIPRVNLAAVGWRVSVRKNRPEVLEWNLPYEMLIVAATDTKDPTE